VIVFGFDNAKTVTRALQYLDTRDRGQVYVGCPRSYFVHKMTVNLLGLMQLRRGSMGPRQKIS